MGPKRAARASGLSLPRLKRLVKIGAIATRRLPGGGRLEVDVLELKRLLRNSVTPAVTAG
jgi:hypothetical protein